LPLLIVGCSSQAVGPASKPDPAIVSDKIDPWVLTTRDANQTEPALLWNGLLGIRLGRDGTGQDFEGAKYGFFCAEEYETTGEEKIRTLDNPLRGHFRVGNEALDPRKGTDYSQTLDMSTGILRTAWVQQIGKSKLKIDVQTLIHPDKRIIADQWTFDCDDKIAVDGTLPIGRAQSQKFVNQTTFTDLQGRAELSPSGMKLAAHYRATGATDSKPSSVILDKDRILFHGIARDGRPASFERLLSFGKSPNFIGLMAARGIALKMRADWDEPETIKGRFQELAGECAGIWTERWKTDIEIDGPKEDQQAVRSFLFYLRSAIHPETVMSVSPMGLSNAQYNGHVFWDADTWVFPALALVSPETAIQIPHYRLQLVPTARENLKSWLAAGRPTGAGKVEGTSHDGSWGPPGIMFPWESSVSGKETIPGPSQYEHHISGTVAWSTTLAAALGLVGEDQARDLRRGVAHFYANRISGDGPFDLKGTMSPDENHVGDNDLYTNLLAQALLDDTVWWKAPESEKVKLKLKLPRDDKTFLTYDNDTLRGYKQAAAVLAIYPLQYPPAEKEAKAMMDRFADKVTKNGPAMSDSIHALIWARLGEKDKAYEAWHNGWQPFTNLPLLLFSEKRAKPVTYFTTGAAGCLQTVLYGFLGFRIDSEQVPGAAWSKKLHGDSWLSIKPNLPPTWKSVKFKNFKLLGESYTLTATPTATKVAPGE
jgi:trehalose/maltose hydrolase-like predicted phosphorylase